MKVICFKGEKKVGKSTTINKILREKLKVNISKPKINKDFCLSFIYNSELIGVCSVGDTIALLKKFLIPLKDIGCEWIICACHPTKKAEDFIKSLDVNAKFIDCFKPTPEDEEHWAIEHSKRIEEFLGLFSV